MIRGQPVPLSPSPPRFTSDPNILHLYLHIPFCHRICPYCSFYKHTPGETDLARFIDALLSEARRRSSELQSPILKTVYLGGGTPSMLSPHPTTASFHGTPGGL